MIVYLHGFNCSPAVAQGAGAGPLHGGAGARARSTPARRCRRYAGEAIRAIEKRDRARRPDVVTLVGSSLGGFYATYLAEKHGCRAVLINPAIDPHVGLRAYLGTQKNLHTGEPYELTEAHLRGLAQAAGAAHRLRSATCCCWRPATKCSTSARRSRATRARAR